MKIKFLATSNAPSSYKFINDVVVANHHGAQIEIDLSSLDYGDKVESIEIDGEEQSSVIREVFRDKNGVLNAILCQKAPLNSNWVESDWIDSSDYDKNILYIKEE